MKIKKFVFNPIQVNTYVVYDETNECVVIDAGCYSENERQELMSFLEQNNLKPIRVLNTHLHIDHILGNTLLFEKYNLLPQANKEDDFLLKQAVFFATSLGMSLDKDSPKIGEYLSENDIVKFGNSELKVIHVPGHSPGSIVFYNEKQNFLFAGDVLFKGSIGRTDLPSGDYDELINGIKNKLFVLPDDVIVYTGHGEQTTIGKEKNSNPFFK
ncbi:MAG: MBL fold metallo-hydrolase [Bacteroidetes bacterium]|nr:MBL fold metallo-hydrolase [Bacteroidota bacterium]